VAIHRRHAARFHLGHGGYVAPDWTADWLHREAMAMLEGWAATETGQSYASLSHEQQAALRGRLESRIRTNTYDTETQTITIDRDRASAVKVVAQQYDRLFGSDASAHDLREAYAMRNDTVPDAANRQALAAFVWWTAWAASTNRPGTSITYTNNWPGEPLMAIVRRRAPICGRRSACCS
jgi:nitric oxide reductase subunit B